MTLTTDFGDSPYVAQMKGTILRIDGNAEIVDITHAIRPQDVRQGAFALYAAVPHFPPAVHAAVVDPGVGSGRAALAVRTERASLVGPDNGLLMPAARRLGMLEVRRIENRRLMAEEVSPTFHGRDVFAPVAAHLAAGVPFDSVGPRTRRWTPLDFGAAKRTDEGLETEVVTVDPFGNVVLNAERRDLTARLEPGDPVEVIASGAMLDAVFGRTYADVAMGETVLLVGSSDFAEISVNRGSASSRLGVTGGETVRLRFAASKG